MGSVVLLKFFLLIDDVIVFYVVWLLFMWLSVLIRCVRLYGWWYVVDMVVMSLMVEVVWFSVVSVMIGFWLLVVLVRLVVLVCSRLVVKRLVIFLVFVLCVSDVVCCMFCLIFVLLDVYSMFVVLMSVLSCLCVLFMMWFWLLWRLYVVCVVCLFGFFVILFGWRIGVCLWLLWWWVYLCWRLLGRFYVCVVRCVVNDYNVSFLVGWNEYFWFLIFFLIVWLCEWWCKIIWYVKFVDLVVLICVDCFIMMFDVICFYIDLFVLFVLLFCLSVFDKSFVVFGEIVVDVLVCSVLFVCFVDVVGYYCYWFVEYYNMVVFVCLLLEILIVYVFV